MLFYRNKILNNNIDLNRVKGVYQIDDFPITEQEELFSQIPHVYPNNTRADIVIRSSGTTGRPKNVHLTSYDWFHLRRLAYLRMFFTSGCSVSYKTLFLNSRQSHINLKQEFRFRLKLMQEKFISIDNLGFNHVTFFNQYRPDVLYCLTSDGVILADLIRQQKKYTHKAKYIFTTGEVLTNKNRDIILANLGNNIIDFYANTETGIIAWQCARTGKYHVNADQIYVEILNGNKVCQNYEVGEVVITTLMPCFLPLIRYRTGDMAIIEHGRCECGSWFPRLSFISGRKNDFLVDANGKKISPYLLMRIMDNFKEVIKYKICQLKPKEYIIYVKLDKSFNSAVAITDNIARIYSNVFGIKSYVSIADLDDFPVDVKMKSQTIVSYVKPVHI